MEAAALTRALRRRFGELSATDQARIAQAELAELESLAGSGAGCQHAGGGVCRRSARGLMVLRNCQTLPDAARAACRIRMPSAGAVVRQALAHRSALHAARNASMLPALRRTPLQQHLRSSTRLAPLLRAPRTWPFSLRAPQGGQHADGDQTAGFQLDAFALPGGALGVFGEDFCKRAGTVQGR